MSEIAGVSEASYWRAAHAQSEAQCEALRDQLTKAEDALRGALEAIAPCVVGWPENEMPTWAERLSLAVPPIQQALGIRPVTP